MLQTIIVIAAIVLAGLYLVRRYIRQAKGPGGRGGGCGCDSGCECGSSPQAVKPVDILDSVDTPKKRAEKK